MLSSPGRGVGKRPRSALLPAGGTGTGGLQLIIAVLASLVVASSCLTGSHNRCPRHLDCARAGRSLCLPPDTDCGSCLSPLVENSHGKCVIKRRIHPHVGKETTYPELDEEIDFLSTVIGEQRETARIPVPPAQDVPEPKKAVAPSPAQRSNTQSPLPNSTTPASTANVTAVRLSNPKTLPYPSNDYVFIVMSGVFVAVACLAFTITGVCWVRLQKGVRLAQKVDYPAYGLMAAHSYDNNVPGEKKLAHSAQMYHYQHPGDKKLAHSAQMYHYQHQKQQMLSLEKQRDEPKVSDSGATSDEENEDGDFTVYECPGLAPTGEMEVKNPLFDDSTLYHQRFHK